MWISKPTWVFVAVCVCLGVLFPHESQAQADHRLVWRTLTTPHFRIHYHEPLGVLARILASRAEGINSRVESALGLRLSQPVNVVLADSDDDANGFANVLPYNAIHLRVVAPDDLSVMADHDDWPTTLLTHEFTHIMHLEQMSGIPALLRTLFGRAYAPQTTLPPWFIEGLAVVEESAQTSAGRVRSPMFAMYLRMAALENAVMGLDWMGFDGEPWPHGNARYVYGQAFLQYVVERYGQRALGRFIEEYGKRLVPYGINRALKRATGRTFTELYPEFVAELRRKAAASLEAVNARGRVEGTRLTWHGELTRSPRFLSDQEVVYSVADARHVPEIRRLHLTEPGASERLQRVPTVATLTRVPGQEQVVYSSVEYHRGAYAYDELSRLPLAGGRRRLTHALRAREPDVSRDGKRIAFVTHAAGTSHLEIAELADIEGTHRVAVRSRRMEQVFTPRWSPDGARIAYSAWSRGGYRDIWLLDVATGVRTRVTYDRALDRGPVFSPDGKRLYFSSDRSGIDNLYAYDLKNGQLSQITNVIGGAFQPDVSPDGTTLVYVGYGSKGFDLYALNLAEHAPLEALAPRELPPAQPLPEPLVQRSEPYRAYATLYPRSWQVGQDTGPLGDRVVLTTTGGDVVGWHAWSLQLTQGIDTWNDRSIDVGYSYRRPRFPVLLHAVVTDQVRNDFILNGRRQDWDARLWFASAGTNLAFPRPLRTLNLRAEYQATFLESTSDTRFVFDPNTPPPRFPRTGFDARTVLTLTHASAQRQPFDISNSWGHVATVSASLRDPYVGSQTRSQGLSWRFEQFVRFKVRESVIALAYTGAWQLPVAVGGYPAQLVPLFDYVSGTRGAPADYARLRGFTTRSGQNLEVLQLEYRFLLVRINRGIQTLPLFARRLHAAVFADAGDAWNGRFDLARAGIGVGGELRLDWANDYGNTNFTLRAGIAQGLTTGGQLQGYTTIARPF